MARLLVLLACARGAAGIMDALDIKAVCEVPADGPRKIYLDMDAEAFEGPGWGQFRSSTRASSDAARATAKLPSIGTSGPRLATATSRG